MKISRRRGASFLRITGGRLKGRPLRAPKGAGVRPTADRVREALFARLGDLEGARVLDLYAGSGALGIEALSRGAASALFVERGKGARAVLRANLVGLALGGESRVLGGDARSALRRLAREGRRFDLVLLDPPYASGEAERALRELAAADLLAPGGLVVVESARRNPPGEVPGLAQLDQRRYGDTLILRFERAGSRPAAEPDGAQSRRPAGPAALDELDEPEDSGSEDA